MEKIEYTVTLENTDKGFLVRVLVGEWNERNLFSVSEHFTLDKFRFNDFAPASAKAKSEYLELAKNSGKKIACLRIKG